MIEINRILCPVDFSDFSRHALDHAVAIARWYGSTIEALHVYSPVPVPVPAPGPVVFAPMVLTGAARQVLFKELEQFAETEVAPGVLITPVLLEERNVAATVLAESARIASDLIVVGTHGRTGFERLLLGSVAEKVVRKAACPVLTVPRRAPDAVPMDRVVFRRILCAIDFSQSSMRALKYAESLAKEADGELTVLHVLAPDIDEATRFGQPEELSLAAYLHQREAEARSRLAEIAPRQVEAYRTEEPLLTHGKPSTEILRLAAERQVDLIVLGVAGRSAIDAALFGSTAQAVLRESTCPVLTIRLR